MLVKEADKKDWQVEPICWNLWKETFGWGGNGPEPVKKTEHDTRKKEVDEDGKKRLAQAAVSAAFRDRGLLLEVRDCMSLSLTDLRSSVQIPAGIGSLSPGEAFWLVVTVEAAKKSVSKGAVWASADIQTLMPKVLEPELMTSWSCSVSDLLLWRIFHRTQGNGRRKNKNADAQTHTSGNR